MVRPDHPLIPDNLRDSNLKVLTVWSFQDGISLGTPAVLADVLTTTGVLGICGTLELIVECVC